jgi:hypothetical protein
VLELLDVLSDLIAVGGTGVIALFTDDSSGASGESDAGAILGILDMLGVLGEVMEV